MILSQLNVSTPIHPLGIIHMSVIIHVVRPRAEPSCGPLLALNLLARSEQSSLA